MLTVAELEFYEKTAAALQEIARSQKEIAESQKDIVKLLKEISEKKTKEGKDD